MRKILFDLDGTLINSQSRLYCLFAELCKENNFSYTEYWSLKRNFLPQKVLLEKFLHYSEDQIKLFNKLFLEKVEEPKRMQLDTPVAGILEALKTLKRNHSLYIVTNRQSHHETVKQIERFGWTNFFEGILVTQQKVHKLDVIKNNLQTTTEDVFVTDTGEDIATAHQLGLIAVAVTWGISNKKLLQQYNPDYIIDTVSDLINLSVFKC